LHAIEQKSIKLERIAKEKQELDPDSAASYFKAAEAGFVLHIEIENAAIAYIETNDKDRFILTVDAAIAEAKISELKNHRGYQKNILANAGLAVLAILTVCTAGIAYALAGAINLVVNRKFFFSRQTESINLVDDLKNAAHKVKTLNK
jgi:hypothetical protein